MTPEPAPLLSQPVYLPPKPIRVLRDGVNVAARQLLAVSGLGMIVLAVPVGIATPFIPIGLPLAIVGVVLLGRNAVWGRRWMESILARHPRVERLAPNWLMRSVFGREKRLVSE
ncbi:MAG: hypothetical protein ACK4Y9_04240 [Hyphomonas sp.]